MSIKKIIIVIIVLLALTTFFYFDLSQYLDFQYLKDNQLRFNDYYQDNPLLVAVIFFLIYVASTALSVPGAALFLPMGLDAFLEIHTWKRCRQLLTRVQPVVVTRSLKEAAAAGDVDDRATMDDYIHSHLPGGYASLGGAAGWRHPDGSRIHLLKTAPLTISSSQVRRRIAAGKAIGDLVPVPVKAYIDEKELYR